MIRNTHQNPDITFRCPTEISLGVTGGGLRRRSKSVDAYSGHVGAEVSVGKYLLHKGISGWLSGGSRLELSREDPQVAGASYLEGGVTLAFLVLGGGAGVRYTADTVQVGPQLFVGMAWYLIRRPFLYVEPYYRVSFLFDVNHDRGALYVHEFGLQFRLASQRAMYLTCANGPIF